MATENKAIQHARGTLAQWDTANPTLLDGQVGVATDSQIVKLGDGSTPWRDLPARGLSDSPVALKDSGFARNARHTRSAVTMRNRHFMGAPGLGNAAYLPLQATVSQNGTIVTSATPIFTKEHVGAVIRWDSGESAVIVGVDNSGASWGTITTCVVDRSQTIASSAATVDARAIVGITYGDSLGNRTAPALQRVLYRTLGFGGYIAQANNAEGTQGANIVRVEASGGATDATNDDGLADMPWGARWDVPQGGALTFTLGLDWSLGEKRDTRHGLEPEELICDHVVLVWRRAAGALSVERKRTWDASWESVANIADTGVGSGSFGSARFDHDLGPGWSYRVTSSNGTVQLISLSFLNTSEPGYVHWPLSRGGENLSDFAQLSGSALEDLCRIHGQPVFRVIHSADGLNGTSAPSAYATEIEADRSLWASAAPLLDHIWVEGYNSGGTAGEEAANAARERALRELARRTGDGIIPLRDLFGTFAPDGAGTGLIEDAIHPGIKGGAVIAQAVLEALGIDAAPLAREGRDVSARRAEVARLRLAGGDMATRLTAEAHKGVMTGRGARWVTTNAGPLQSQKDLSADIGTGDFTVSLRLDVLEAPSVHYLFGVGSDAANVNAAGTIVAIQEGQRLRIDLRDGAGDDIQYRFDQFGDVLGGQSGVLTIRSDTARGRFDVFWNGQLALFLQGSLSGNGTPLGVWSGAGRTFFIEQHSTNTTDFFHAGIWLERLSDGEIRQIAETDAPAQTQPELWWDFSDGMGRIVSDRTPAARHGIIRRANPQQYNLAQGALAWRFPRSGLLGRPWIADLNAVATLLPGDHMIAQQANNRDIALPAQPEVGDRVRVTKATTARIRITVPALHQIRTGLGDTTGTNATQIGAPGRIQFDGDYDSVALMCTRAEAGVAFEWVVTDTPASGLTWN
ncbi:MAG: hypothetical protein AAGB05_00005 [Pseudomonadota bacterium]